MSLEGNLTAFGLSEILQLIAVQQKSGMLSVRSEERTKVLFFRNGNIMSTRDRRRKTRDPLKDYLTRYGILSREDLIRLTQITAQSKLDLTDIIMSEGFLNELETFACRPPRVYEHKWQVGDLIVFDNRRLLHRACPYDEQGETRELLNCRITGDAQTDAGLTTVEAQRSVEVQRAELARLRRRKAS